MVKIDQKKCLGCGACVSACEKGFEIKNGKAEIRDSKALCLKEGVEACPVDAISI